MARRLFACLVATLCLGAPACRAPAGEAGGGAALRAEVEATLDAFHQAAAEADGEAYFALMAPDLVYLGTDRTERWSREEFRAWAQPYFEGGRGWTYRVLRRHVQLGPRGDLAWFDEELENDSYGSCRGSGVLRRSGRGWTIVQYNLALPVPNELARDLVERIRLLEAAPRPGS